MLRWTSMTTSRTAEDHAMSPISPDSPQQQSSAIDEWIGSRLPGWLQRASGNQVKRLREALNAHQATQARLRGRALGLLPVHRFAEQRFAALLAGPLPDGVTFGQLEWLTVLPDITSPPQAPLLDYDAHLSRENGLLRLMSNFAAGERFYQGSGLVAGADDTLLSSADVLAGACRALDVGALYQAELDRVYDAATQEVLGHDKRSGLWLAMEMAALQGRISAADQLALREVLDVGQMHVQFEVKGYPGLPQVLGQPLADGLLIHLRDSQGTEQGVLLYLPGDPREVLRRYDSAAAMNRGLANDLQDARYRQHFTRLISLEQRPAFVARLDKRLQDTMPDLELEGQVQPGNVFQAMARRQVHRLKADARQLLVPTAEADTAAGRARLAAWKAAGLDLLNLSGLFIPAVGALLLADVIVHSAGQIFEGMSDWSLGHQHEALEHVLGVAATLAATASTVATVTFVRSAFLEGMEWVSDEGDTLRLWPNDLGPYASEPGAVSLQADGRFSDGQRDWIRMRGRYFEMYRPAPGRLYRLRHPVRPGAYEPRLLHNGERCWQLLYQRAQAWDDAAQMLDTLWPLAQPRSAVEARQILRAADMDIDELRGLLVENRRTPINLRDTLERFEAVERLETFFQQLRQDPAALVDPALLAWCRTRAQVSTVSEILERQAALRAPMLAHLSRLPDTEDELAQLLGQNFSRLPGNYARALSLEVSEAQREQAIAQRRLPLGLMTRARALARLARFNRMLAGLYLPSAYTDDSGVLVMALLDRLGIDGLRLSLARDVAQHESLASVETGTQATPHWVLVHQEGVFRVYDDAGAEVGLGAADDIFGALEHVLAAQGETRQAGAALRERLLAVLPDTQQGITGMLGWPARDAWFNPGQRLADGRVGYLLSGRGAGRLSQREILRDGLRQYFPGLDDAQLELELEVRWRRGVRAHAVLRALEDDLQQLDKALGDWVGFALDDASRAIRERFAERLQRAWRGLGETQLTGGRGQRLGLHLNFSDLPVATLPELPLQVDFFHVKALVINDTTISHVHAGFLRAFTDLQRLDLSHNHLLRCPDGLGYLINLRRLRLAGNQIRLDANAVEALSRLPLLSHLDLSENRVVGAFNLPFDHLSHLVELRLRRCALREWPRGLSLCGFLKLVDLRGNALRGAPREILNMPQVFRESLLVDDNRLTLHEMANLAALDPIQEPLEYAQGREWWVASGAGAAAHGQMWDTLQAVPGNDDLFLLLERLEAVADYSWSKAFLHRQVWRILAFIHTDADFATAVRGLLARRPNDDNSVLSLFSQVLQLHADALAGQPTTRLTGAQLLALGKGLFRLERLQSFAQADILARGSSLRASEHGALALRYRLKLRRALALPFQPQRMYEVGSPVVSELQLGAAQDAVQAASTPQAMAVDLCRRAFWQRFLERYDVAAFAVSQPEAERRALSERLTLEFMQRMARIADDSERGIGR
jgi:hypothetical protein